MPAMRSQGIERHHGVGPPRLAPDSDALENDGDQNLKGLILDEVEERRSIGLASTSVST
ncbi:MAG: hypothetical protein HKL80_12345 [Acidimicrobiales bacterium]|nr:hypothetical protein [Acidimicrobiales bacterium]